MERKRFWAWVASAVVTLTVAGCASVDPAPAVDSTGRTLAAKGIVGVEWRIDDAENAAALERSRALLAAPLTADAAAQVALLRSPELQGTLAELGIAQADLAQATRFANPGFAFSSLSGGGHEQVTTGLFADVVDWLTQPLRRRLAEAELERVKLEVGAAVLEQVAAARTALVEAQAAEQLVARLATIEQLDRAAAEYAGALHDAGNLTSRDKANAEAGWAQTKGELGEARAETTRKREAVIRTLGLSPDETWSAAPLFDPPPASELGAVELEEIAVRERLELAAARWAVEALERARNLRRRTRWLPVGVEVGVERERDIQGTTISGPTVELALPIFDSGKASLARFDAELARARSQLAALEARIRSAVREKASDLSTASELATLYGGTVLPLRRQVLQQTLREYNQMVAGTFEVLIAKQEEIAAERRFIETLTAAWVARFELDRVLGTLRWESGGLR